MKEDQTKPIPAGNYKRRVFVFALVFLLICSLVAPHFAFIQRPRFIRHWSQQFRSVASLDAAKRLEQSESVFVRTFPSGEWFIAACEHSCCSGAGFDATVIRDSTGAIYTDTTHTFCGLEGMSSELSRVPADTLASFYPQLTELDLHKQ